MVVSAGTFKPRRRAWLDPLTPKIANTGGAHRLRVKQYPFCYRVGFRGIPTPRLPRDCGCLVCGLVVWLFSRLGPSLLEGLNNLENTHIFVLVVLGAHQTEGVMVTVVVVKLGLAVFCYDPFCR